MTWTTKRDAVSAAPTVRAFRADDATHLSRIYKSAVRSLAARYYSPEQIAAWLSIAPEADAIAALYSNGRTALVCTVDEQPVAFADHDVTGHIKFLYCDPAHAGGGATGLLMAAVEASARSKGVACLSSEASEAARGFFLRRAFRVIGRRDFEVAGVAIHNYAVEKSLFGSEVNEASS